VVHLVDLPQVLRRTLFLSAMQMMAVVQFVFLQASVALLV
jgi:hypothetical protein